MNFLLSQFTFAGVRFCRFRCEGRFFQGEEREAFFLYTEMVCRQLELAWNGAWKAAKIGWALFNEVQVMDDQGRWCFRLVDEILIFSSLLSEISGSFNFALWLILKSTGVGVQQSDSPSNKTKFLPSSIYLSLKSYQSRGWNRDSTLLC